MREYVRDLLSTDVSESERGERDDWGHKRRSIAGRHGEGQLSCDLR